MTALLLIFVDSPVALTRLITEPLSNNVFVVQCTATKKAVLIDAAGESDLLLSTARDLGVERVLTTHGHWDHIGAVPQMRAAGYRVGIGAGDEERMNEYDFVIRDGDVFDVGDLRVEAIATPGHTAGSTCFYVHETDLLFSGDTLFPKGPGATHFPGGDFNTIIKSIDQRLYRRFDDQTVVWPGHGASTTIGAEKPHLGEWIVRYGDDA